MSEENLKYQVKAAIDEVNSFTVVGVSVVTEKDKAAEDINFLWERFFTGKIGQNLEHKADDVIYCVYSDYEGDHTKPYRVTIGYRVSETGQDADDLHGVIIQNATYAILGAAGEQPRALLDTWKTVWESDLDRAYKTDFEVYGPRFFAPDIQEVLVHVGLKEDKT